MGALLVGVEKVADLINRCKVYELLYVDDHDATQAGANLERALVVLYTTILKFLAMAHHSYQNSGSRILNGIFNPDKVKEFVDQCGALEKRVDIEVSNCESTHSRKKWGEHENKLKQILLELKSKEEPIKRTDIRVEALFHSLNETERCKMLTWVSDIPYQANHYTAGQGRTAGTGEWLLAHEKLRDWRKSNTSMILWLHGIRKLFSYLDC